MSNEPDWVKAMKATEKAVRDHAKGKKDCNGVIRCPSCKEMQLYYCIADAKVQATCLQCNVSWIEGDQ